MEIRGIDKWILPVYHPYARDYKTRTSVFYGSAGSGKSYFVTQKIALKCLVMKRKVLVIRKVGTTLKDSVWALFLEVLGQLGNPIKEINKTDFTIKLINGSAILFKSMDNPEKIKSIVGITDIWCEEATEISENDYNQLCLRLRSKKPYNQVTLTFNPTSKNNFVYKYFFENGIPNDCKVVHTTYKDNPHLPKAYVDSLRDLITRNPTYYKIYVLGEFCVLDKLIFPVYEKRLISSEEVKLFKFWIAVDFGFTNDPTAIVWGRYDAKSKTIYICGEYVKKGMTNDEIAEVIKQLGFTKETIIADSSEPKSIEEIRRFGIPRIKGAVKGKDSIINGIDKMSRCKIIIDERCINALEEFDNYTWQKDRNTGEYINKPVDAFCHVIDGCRYALQPIIGKKSGWKV